MKGILVGRGGGELPFGQGGNPLKVGQEASGMMVGLSLIKY